MGGGALQDKINTFWKIITFMVSLRIWEIHMVHKNRWSFLLMRTATMYFLGRSAYSRGLGMSLMNQIRVGICPLFKYAPDEIEIVYFCPRKKSSHGRHRGQTLKPVCYKKKIKEGKKNVYFLWTRFCLRWKYLLILNTPLF